MSTVEQRLRAALAAKSDAVSLADYHVELREPDALLALPDPYHHGRQRWHAVVAAAVAAVVLIVVGVTVLSGRNSHHLASAGRAEVPWSQVGPDWTLVVVADSGSVTDHDLDLVSPAGVRYLICQLPAPLFELQPWTISGKAILVAGGLETAVNDVLIVDLHTGAQTRTRISSYFSTIQFATPGLDSLLVTYPSFMQLVSINTGQVLVRYPVTNIGGSALSPDESQIVTGGAGGLTVLDRTSGRRIRTLTSPTGYNFCNVLRWVPATNEVLALCLPRGGNKVPPPTSTFTFATDGLRAPLPERVPAGWHELRLATGSVAFQHELLDEFAPMDVPFARVTPAGQLQPLALPAALEHGSWQLVAVGTGVLLFDEYQGLSSGPTVRQLATWNPLTGTFTSLIATGSQQPPIVSWATWQEYSP